VSVQVRAEIIKWMGKAMEKEMKLLVTADFQELTVKRDTN
jgi:hypothetical protein